MVLKSESITGAPISGTGVQIQWVLVPVDLRARTTHAQLKAISAPTTEAGPGSNSSKFWGTVHTEERHFRLPYYKMALTPKILGSCRLPRDAPT